MPARGQRWPYNEGAEVGKTVTFAAWHWQTPSDAVRPGPGARPQAAGPGSRPGPRADSESEVSRSPAGPVGDMTPWHRA
jgi:hypothetical protein